MNEAEEISSVSDKTITEIFKSMIDPYVDKFLNEINFDIDKKELFVNRVILDIL